MNMLLIVHKQALTIPKWWTADGMTDGLSEHLHKDLYSIVHSNSISFALFKHKMYNSWGIYHYRTVCKVKL